MQILASTNNRLSREAMKRTLFFVAIILILTSCNAVSEPSEKQVQFSNELVGQRGIIKAEWYNSLSLDVTVDLDSMGINPEKQAQLLSDKIATAGHTYTGESICVRIYYGYLNKLASSCLYK